MQFVQSPSGRNGVKRPDCRGSHSKIAFIYTCQVFLQSTLNCNIYSNSGELWCNLSRFGATEIHCAICANVQFCCFAPTWTRALRRQAQDADCTNVHLTCRCTFCLFVQCALARPGDAMRPRDNVQFVQSCNPIALFVLLLLRSCSYCLACVAIA